MVNGTITEFFLHRGDHYEKIFSGDQFIDKIDFSDNRLDSFTSLNPGCCADPQFLEYYYSVKYLQDKISFTLTKTVGYILQHRSHRKFFQLPTNFLLSLQKRILEGLVTFLTLLTLQHLIMVHTEILSLPIQKVQMEKFLEQKKIKALNGFMF